MSTTITTPAPLAGNRGSGTAVSGCYDHTENTTALVSSSTFSANWLRRRFGLAESLAGLVAALAWPAAGGAE